MKNLFLFSLLMFSFTMSLYGQLKPNLKKAKSKIDKVLPNETNTADTNVPSKDVSQESNQVKDESITFQEKPDEPHNGFNSDFHIANKKKIVFARSVDDISLNDENIDQLITKATVGNQIWFRVYLDNSLVNYLKINTLADAYGTFLLKYYIDNQYVGNERVDVNTFSSSNKRDYTSFKGALKSDDPDNPYIGEVGFNDALIKHENLFTMGEHDFRLEIYPYETYSKYEGKLMAAGEMKLVVTKSLVNPNNTSSCLPKTEMNDNALESKIKKAFSDKGWGYKPQAVKILSKNWIIRKNEYTGAIISRYVDAVVGYKGDDGCLYEEFSFTQDFSGSGYQTEVYLDGVGGKTDMSCGCLK